MDKKTTTILFLVWLVFSGKGLGQGIVVDHTSLGQFDQIPETYLQAARNLRVLFMDRSVGANMNSALDCLTATEYGQ
jgi:hypothetical protein